MLILERVIAGRVSTPVVLAVGETFEVLKEYNRSTATATWLKVAEDRWETPQVGHGYWQIHWVLKLTPENILPLERG